MKHLTLYVTDVKTLDEYKLLLTFENGVQKIYDMKDKLTGYYLESLKDTELFKQAFIEAGAIEWPNGASVCHDELYRNGEAIQEKIA
ncbi:MAG: DUF2442 domain-containing protein [Vulcanimicrobiota bacterium]